MKAQIYFPFLGQFSVIGILLSMAGGVSQVAAQTYALRPLPPLVVDAVPPARIELGKKLFYDRRLSADKKINCEFCHRLMSSGADLWPVSFGVGGQVGGRNAQTVWNAAYLRRFFWDGRAGSLEEQALGPLVNPVEMGNRSVEEVVARIQSIQGYPELFQQAFPESPVVSTWTLGQAIAAFERTLVTPGAPFDRYLQGENSAISEYAKNGYRTFVQVGCMECHSGPLFNGMPETLDSTRFARFPRYPNAELEAKYGFSADLGLQAVSKRPQDAHFFRVPSLRNVAITRPYFHNGKVFELTEAVRIMAKVQLNQDLSSESVRDLVEFLKTLTGERPKIRPPLLPGNPGF